MIKIVIVMCLANGGSWLHSRFVIYRSQGWLLKPTDYQAEVVPASSAVPEERRDQFRKSVDGQYYVCVGTLGTAHYLGRVGPMLVGPFIMALLVFIMELWLRVKQRSSETKPPSN